METKVNVHKEGNSNIKKKAKYNECAEVYYQTGVIDRRPVSDTKACPEDGLRRLG